MARFFTIKFLFLANAIIELLGGIIILLYPSVLLLGAQQSTETVAISKMYALSVFLIGIVSYQCFKYYDSVSQLFKILFLSIATYHLLIGFQLYGYYNIGVIDKTGPFALHFVMALLFITVYLKEK